MSLVPNKVRRTKKVPSDDRLDAFVDEGLAGKAQRRAGTSSESPSTPVRDPGQAPARSPEADPEPSPGRRRGAQSSSAKKKDREKTWRDSMQRAPSVAFSVRIPTPLLDRMRDVVAAVDGESLTRLLVEGAANRVMEIEDTYVDQVGQPLPARREKVEL